MLRDSLGNVGIWFMNGPVISAGALVGSPGVGCEIVMMSDYNGDGKADVLLRNSTTVDVEMWLMNGSVIVSGASVASVWRGDRRSLTRLTAVSNHEGPPSNRRPRTLTASGLSGANRTPPQSGPFFVPGLNGIIDAPQ